MSNTCDRCNAPLNNISYYSWYNNQLICKDCRVEEALRPDYAECRKAEAEAVKQGHLNFHFLPPWREER